MTDNPEEEVIIDGATISPDILSTQVTRRENGIDDAVLIANDEAGKSYLGSLHLGDPVVISYKYADGDNIWHSVFKGTIEELAPNMSKAGEVVSATAYGLGYPLKCSVIATEIGIDSENSSWETVGKGIRFLVYNWVDKLFNDTILDHEGNIISSGYNLDTYCADSIAPNIISYMEFKYQDCLTALNDLLMLAESAAYNADPVNWVGFHWIVDPIVMPGLGNCLYFAPIGEHDFGALESYWPSHASSGTFEVKSDFINSSFVREPFAANFVAVSGRYVYPAREYFTENHANEWYTDDVLAHVHDETTIVRVGTKSVFLHANVGYYNNEFWFDIPWTDFTKIGSKDDTPKLDFWVYNANGELEVRLWTTSGDKFTTSITSQCVTNEWVHISLDIEGPYLKEDQVDSTWQKIGTPDWHKITNIGFFIHGPVLGLETYIDGLQIVGSVVCCAYDSTSIAAFGVKVLTIKDSLASLNTVDSTDPNYDTCSLAQTAKGELLRNRVDILSGKISIPLEPHMMGGQLIHIHASKKPDTSFQIDQDMRITTVQHSFSNSSAVSILTLISDLKSSVPRTNANSNQYNQIINAIDPKHQTKTLASLSTGGDFDPKLTRVCKDYPS